MAVFYNNRNLLRSDKIVEEIPEEKTEVVEVIDNTELRKEINEMDIRKFHALYDDKTEEALMYVLSQQSNEHPLKAGGPEIAYRADNIIIANMQKFSVLENNVFDLISGEVSSKPDDDYYVIKTKDAAERLGFETSNYAYTSIKEGVRELSEKPLIYQVPLANGKVREVRATWYEVLTYYDKDALDDDEECYISFTPTKFFKLLTTSSSISHGAHYNIKVAAQIQSKYARTLYYFLQSKKKYRKYEGAPTGVFTLTIEEVKDIVGCPDSYKANDIKRRVLEPAMAINQIDGVDYNFTFEEIKTNRRVTGYKFKVTDNLIKKLSKKEEFNPEMDMVTEILKGFGYSEKDSISIFEVYKENNKTIADLTQAATKTITTPGVENKTGYLITLLRNELNDKPEQKPNQKNNKFKNFTERNNDYDSLQAELIKKSMEG